MSANLENSAVATGLKTQFSFQSQRWAMPNNVPTTIYLYSFHTLARLCSKCFKLGFKEAEEPKMNLPTFFGSWRKQGSPRKTSASASLTTLKPLTMWITWNSGKFLNSWEFQATLSLFWDTCMWVKKQQLEPYMEYLIVSKMEKEYDKVLFIHSAYLT